MAGVKIIGFLGTAPKISPELLPNAAGQIATNCKLYSGDLIPYPQPTVVANTGRTGTIKTLFALRDPITGAKKWLSWLTDVDIAVASKTDLEEQRFYYTGDGVPKVSNYQRAVNGYPAPYPVGSYDLGLPVPPDSAKLSVTTTPFVSKSVYSYTRDANNIVTIQVLGGHNLRSGNLITISGFAYIDGTYTQGGTSKSGTMLQSSALLTAEISITAHGLQTGAVARLAFSGYGTLNGAYSVTVINQDLFAITMPTAAARSGSVTLDNYGTSAVTVTINNHGLSNGAQVTLDVTSGTLADGAYVVSNVTTNTFQINASIAQSTGGNLRWDIRSLNVTNAECTVTGANTFTYFSPGPQIAETFPSVGAVTLGGIAQARNYVFTWYTPWEEESIASIPSDTQYIKEGTITAVTNVPAVTPSLSTFIRGVRLYRTLASASGTEYYLLKTLWFPTLLSGTAQRVSNVSRVTTVDPHNLDIDDRFKISTAGTFSIAGGIVSAVISDYVFEYAQTGADVAPTNLLSGVLYHDVSEDPPTTPPRYWGDAFYATYTQSGTPTVTVTAPGHSQAVGSRIYLSITSGALASGVYTVSSITTNTFNVVATTSATTSGNIFVSGFVFVDDFDSRDLFDILASDDYDAPPEDLQGLTAIQNNILCGFVGNTLYFSEPGLPHAWPAKYAVTLEHNIVGIAAISGSALVVTDSYPYIVSGSDPANGMSTARIDANFPCLNKNSIVTMGYGIVYATHDGLAVYSPSSGAAIITKLLYNNDTWQSAIDPSTVIAEYYGDNYFASHSTGAFIFEQDAKVGGFFVNADYSFTASWYDAVDGIVYYVSGVNGDVYEWDDLSQPPTTQEWKSKVIITKDMINLGAARVVADYATTSDDWDAETSQWDAAFSNWNLPDQITFRLWVDKELIFFTTINDSEIFRLPTGYRTDTFEVGVEGNVRVRAIHVAETPLGLREV
jgi:hypothetical protein